MWTVINEEAQCVRFNTHDKETALMECLQEYFLMLETHSMVTTPHESNISICNHLYYALLCLDFGVALDVNVLVRLKGVYLVAGHFSTGLCFSECFLSQGSDL